MGRTRTLTYRDAAGAPSHRYAPIPPPPAIKLNLRIGDAVLTTTGRYMASLPTEQQIALAWGVPRGRLQHAPEVGHDFLSLPRANQAALEAEIQRRVPLANPVDRLLASGEMEIISVRSHHPKSTESRIVVTYRLRGSSANRTFDSAHVGEVAAEPATIEQSYPTWIVDSSPFVTPNANPNNSIAEIWGYSDVALSEPTYTDGPSSLIRLHTRIPPADGPGRGHGICLLQSGHMLVAASETSPGNYHEGWTLIPPGASGKQVAADCPFYKSGDIFAHIVTPEVGTARHTVQFEDGTILIGGASHWAMCSLDDLLNGTMTGLPTWTLPGVHGTYANYDAAVIPGTKTVIFENNNGISIVDFDVPPGAINTANVKRAGGSNFGTGSPADLFGHLALGPDLRLYKQRASSSDIAWWNMSTLEALTSTLTNPAPDGVMTSPAFDNLEAGVEHLFCCLEFDNLGRLYTASQRSSNYSNPVYESATMWRFSAAGAAAGGPQEPECTVTLPNYSQPWMLRCAPVHRLHAR
jgi:hypothetical protein